MVEFCFWLSGEITLVRELALIVIASRPLFLSLDGICKQLTWVLFDQYYQKSIFHISKVLTFNLSCKNPDECRDFYYYLSKTGSAI